MPDASDAERAPQPRLGRWWFCGIALVVWTALVSVTVVLELKHLHSGTVHIARDHAETLLGQVRLTHGVAQHGGVYVWEGEQSPPNPYLDSESRTVVTADGRRLVLVNPATMTRQLAEMAGAGDVRLHLSSLDPLNPANRPELWEADALVRFRQGQASSDAFVSGPDGVTRFRRIEPLIVDESCLRCHEKHGYHLGDVHGGVSVSFAASDLVQAERTSARATLVGAGLVWLLGMALGLTVTARFDEKQQCLERYAALSIQDDLTRLYNRRGFFAHARRSFGLAVRTRSPLLLLFADVDHLKRINDDRGHAEGDRALVFTADALRSALRETDVVARFGGDEFVVLCPDTTTAQAAAICAKIERALERTTLADLRALRVTVTLGHAEFDGAEPDDLEELIRRADAAMYASKSRRGAPVRGWHEGAN